MKTIDSLVRLALVTLLACTAPVAAQVVARVNGVPITGEQLDRAFENVLRERKLNLVRMQRPAQARDLKRVALDRLIREELFWQQAQKENLAVSDAEVDKSVGETVARYPSKQAFELQLLRQGVDENGFRANVRRLLSADRFADRVVGERVTVPEAEIASYYQANAHLFDRPEQWKVRTIAIAAPATRGVDERRDARARAENLRRELVRGASFDQLARRHSDDPTRQWGGELDPMPLASLPEWMRSAVADLHPGQVSPVVETAVGYHLLKLDARLPPVKVPLAEARQAIHDLLHGMRAREAVEAAGHELRAAAKIELLVPL